MMLPPAVTGNSEYRRGYKSPCDVSRLALVAPPILAGPWRPYLGSGARVINPDRWALSNFLFFDQTNKITT